VLVAVDNRNNLQKGFESEEFDCELLLPEIRVMTELYRQAG
jgi:hypothetical protein